MDTTPAQLIAWVSEARQRTLQLVADLDDDQLLGPRLEIVNPLLWEIGHVAWFQEKWVLRRGGEPSILRRRGRPLRLRGSGPRPAMGPAAARPRGHSTVHGWSARESRRALP